MHDEGLSESESLQSAGVSATTERAYDGIIVGKDSTHYIEFGVQSIAHS